MIELPIGEQFDTFINWLKDSFRGAFDLISSVLDFSISLLEDVLLLNAQNPVASVIFGILLALIVGLLGKRYAGKNGFYVCVIATALLFGIVEKWRVEQLDTRLSPQIASEMKQDFEQLNEALILEAPADFSEVETLLDAIKEHYENEATIAEADALAREAHKANRSIDRTRSNDYEEVYENLVIVKTQIATENATLPEELSETLETKISKYNALMLIEENARMIDDFSDALELADTEEPERMNAFINTRTYSNLMELYDESYAFYDSINNDALENQALTVQKNIRQLNPERLSWYPTLMTIIMMLLIAYLIAGSGIVMFSIIGLFLIISMDLWIPTVQSLALVLSATFFALLLGVPVGILAAGSQLIDKIIRPILDLMQTMPAFVYLIPAVMLFGLGKVPGAMATLIFAMPPAVRLTALGIRQVPSEVVEAAESFGCTRWQMLIKAQLPIAMQTILAGINQTIMLALSMVVIGGMIGAGGLGEVVLTGITQLKLGIGFEGGIAVVILAIYLDRVTQALGSPSGK